MMVKGCLRFIVVLIFLFLQSSVLHAIVSYDDWEGDVSSDWNNANNWEGNSVPGGTQGARIGQTAFTNPPIVSVNSTFTPRYLFVQGGSTLVVSANLSTTRDIYVGQGSLLNLTNGTLSSGNSSYNLNVRNEDTEILVSGGTLTVAGSVYLDRFLDLVPGADPTLNITNGTVNIGGDFRFDGVIAEQPKLVVNGGTLNITGSAYNDGADVNIFLLSGTLNVDGDLNLTDADDSLIATSGTLNLTGNNGNFTNNGIVLMTNNTVNFNENYTLAGTGSTTFNDVVITAGNGAISQTASSINVASDWTNNATYTSNSNEVVFNGVGVQDINGATSFGELTVNKASGTLDLNADVTVTSVLTLTQGIINSDSTNTLSLADNATSSSGDADSYVDGYMRKVGNDNFIFPLGDAGLWSRIGISNATGTNASDAFGAEYVRGVFSEAFFDSLSYAGDPGGMYNVSILDYWKLYREVGAAQPFVTLYWESGDSAQIDNLSDLVVAHYAGSNTWENLGGTTSGTTSAGSVTTSATVSSFSPFTFGSSSASSNPLPVTMVNFNAELSGDVVLVTWTTLSEINNDYFEIEVSTDGINFVKLERIQGAGNSRKQLDYHYTDMNPELGVNSYYRLSQTDFDGSKKVFPSAVVYLAEPDESNTIVVFPNPVEGQNLTVHIPSWEDKTAEFLWYDSQGNLVMKNNFNSEENGYFNINCPKESDMYFLIVSGNSGVYRRKVQVK